MKDVKKAKGQRTLYVSDLILHFSPRRSRRCRWWPHGVELYHQSHKMSETCRRARLDSDCHGTKLMTASSVIFRFLYMLLSLSCQYTLQEVEKCYVRQLIKILWRIDLLLGNDSVNTFPWTRTRANKRTSIARKRISKQTFSTIEWLCFLRGQCRGVIKGQRWSLNGVVRSWENSIEEEFIWVELQSRNGSSSGDGRDFGDWEEMSVEKRVSLL
jgi:hypothetical protein